MNKNEEIPQGWIYLGDENVRYYLGQPGYRNMLVFGANPSTASPGEENLDPTIRKVRKLCANAGYDGWIMANLYPLRSTNPKDLPKEADERLLEKNLEAMLEVEKICRIDAAWAAWGDIIDTRFYLGETLYDIQEGFKSDFQWYYRGSMTKKGNPRHPLYMKAEEEFFWFAVADYAAAWRFAGFY